MSQRQYRLTTTRGRYNNQPEFHITQGRLSWVMNLRQLDQLIKDCQKAREAATTGGWSCSEQYTEEEYRENHHTG